MLSQGSLDAAKRNPGKMPITLDSASLHPGYILRQIETYMLKLMALLGTTQPID